MKRACFIAALALLAAPGCGHSEEEWQAQLTKYDQAVKEGQAKDQELAQARARVTELESQLEKMGATANKLEVTLGDRDKALAEYKARAKQLEMLKARFDLLRRKLEELTRIGLDVTIRRNRMVISLPGDVLFDSGKDTLRKDGLKILEKVASVLKADHSLAERDYQVAGHTDNAPLTGGPFHDNWGLSLMRARSVLLYLGQHGMPRQHWSAAGFADTDPVASNASKEGQQKNRRCDLIVVPDADEMLNLQNLADTGKPHP